MSSGASQETVRLAGRMGLLPPYLFGQINRLRAEKRQAGIDVIDLAMGNPSDPTPSFVVDKLCQAAADRRNHRYSVAAGIFNLRREIAEYYERRHGVALHAEDEIISTIGSKEGISHLALALLGPGDTAIVPAPAFPVHLFSVIIAGGIVLRLPVEDDEILLREIDRLCSKVRPAPKVLLLNYPHNPTAKTVSLDFFEEAAAIARRHRLIVVHDFAYGRMTFDGYEAPSFLQARGAKEIGVEFGSFSKSYNMAGWRVGYCAGNPQIVKALERIKGYFDYGMFQAVQIAAIVALRQGDEMIEKQAKIYERRRDVLCAGLQSAGWTVEKPRASMFVWAAIPDPYRSMGSMAFSLKLLEEAEVAVAPGIGFGEEGEGFVRIALVENEHRLRQAVRQIRKLSAPEKNGADDARVARIPFAGAGGGGVS